MVIQSAIGGAILLVVVLQSTSICVAQTRKDVTLHGELVDIVGFVSSGAKQDADAVSKSAKAGNPIGFYDTKARKVYVVGLPQVNRGANETLMPYVGLRVFITGKIYTKNGVSVILMHDIGKSIK